MYFTKCVDKADFIVCMYFAECVDKVSSLSVCISQCVDTVDLLSVCILQSLSTRFTYCLYVFCRVCRQG